LFKSSDKNSSGILTKKELKKYMKTSAAKKLEILGTDFDSRDAIKLMKSDEFNNSKATVEELVNSVNDYLDKNAKRCQMTYAQATSGYAQKLADARDNAAEKAKEKAERESQEKRKKLLKSAQAAMKAISAKIEIEKKAAATRARKEAEEKAREEALRKEKEAEEIKRKAEENAKKEAIRKEKEASEIKRKAQEEAARIHAKEEKERLIIEAEKEAARLKAESEAALAKAKKEAEIEVARLKAEAAAVLAKAKKEAEIAAAVAAKKVEEDAEKEKKRISEESRKKDEEERQKAEKEAERIAAEAASKIKHPISNKLGEVLQNYDWLQPPPDGDPITIKVSDGSTPSQANINRGDKLLTLYPETGKILLPDGTTYIRHDDMKYKRDGDFKSSYNKTLRLDSDGTTYLPDGKAIDGYGQTWFPDPKNPHKWLYFKLPNGDIMKKDIEDSFDWAPNRKKSFKEFITKVRSQVSNADKKQAEIIKLMQDEDRKQKALRNAKLKMIKAANVIGLTRDLNRSLQIKKKAADDAAEETLRKQKTQLKLESGLRRLQISTNFSKTLKDMVAKKQIPAPKTELGTISDGSKGWVQKVVNHYEELSEKAKKDTTKSEKIEIVQNEIFHATHHNVFANAGLIGNKKGDGRPKTIDIEKVIENYEELPPNCEDLDVDECEKSFGNQISPCLVVKGKTDGRRTMKCRFKVDVEAELQQNKKTKKKKCSSSSLPIRRDHHCAACKIPYFCPASKGKSEKCTGRWVCADPISKTSGACKREGTSMVSTDSAEPREWPRDMGKKCWSKKRIKKYLN
jgi:hypothetical protein